MYETVVTIEDAVRTLPDLVEKVRASGESALLVKSGRPMARIVAVPQTDQGSEDLIAFLRRWRIEHPEPDESFSEAIEDSRRNTQLPHDPWE